MGGKNEGTPPPPPPLNWASPPVVPEMVLQKDAKLKHYANQFTVIDEVQNRCCLRGWPFAVVVVVVVRQS